MSEAENGIALKGEGITKRFGELTALKGIDFEVRNHEVLGIVGENGSGKSTLTKILVGAEKLDSGKLVWKDKPYLPKSPLEAEKSGIFIVYQESALVPDLRIYQWMFLGRVRKKLWQVLAEEMKRDTDEILADLGLSCTANDVIRDLDIATRKMIEIARAFLASKRHAGVEGDSGPLVILDEPTAAFSKNEIDELFQKIRQMKSIGTFIFISHILPEVLSVCDTIMVLRDGKCVANFRMREERISEMEIQKAMLGRELGLERSYSAVDSTEVVLQVDKITKTPHYWDISFELKQGEILAITGPIGQGKSEIGSTIAGILQQDSGSITKDGLPLRNTVTERLERGIGYLSGDNKEELFYLWPIYKNVSQSSLSKLTKPFLRVFKLIDSKSEDDLARKWVERLKIRPQDHKKQVLMLSGGNKQKVALAKWMAANVDVLVMENPTMGIDIGAREELHTVFNEFRASGKSIILISDDQLEANRLANRIIMVERGRTSGPAAVKVGP